MVKECRNILKQAIAKHGNDSHIVSKIALVYSKINKLADLPEVKDITTNKIEIDIKKMLALLFPNEYNIERPHIGTVGVELEK